MTRRLLPAAVFFGAAALAVSPAIAAIPCGNLTGLALPNNTTVDTATSVPAGPFIRPGSTTPTNVPAFCRVAGTSPPTSDSQIHFEVWMPVSRLNGELDHGGESRAPRGAVGPPGVLLVWA